MNSGEGVDRPIHFFIVGLSTLAESKNEKERAFYKALRTIFLNQFQIKTHRPAYSKKKVPEWYMEMF